MQDFSLILIEKIIRLTLSKSNYAKRLPSFKVSFQN